MPIDITRVKAICFDVDGTLSNTDDQFVEKLVRVLSPAGFAFPRRDTRPVARKLVMLSEGPGNWIYSFADRLGWDGKLVAFSDLLYQFRIGESATPFILIDGIMDLLIKLKSRYPLSIISARGQKSTYRFLYQFELLSHFATVATGQTCLHTKPYPDQIIWAAEKMEVPVSSCLMIGDTVVDILAGKRAGAQTIGVLCGFGEEKELRHAGADLIIKKTTDILDLLQVN